jgi:hypothetical protein
MKNIFLAALMLSIVTSTSATTNNQSGQFLLVQTARSAEVKAIPSQPNTYELTLKKASPYVTYFSDRPIRVSGAVSNDKFSQDWQKTFLRDAPNADLVGIADSLLHRKYLNYTIELTDMQYNTAQQTFHYIIHVLPGDKKALPKKLELHDAALFIDGACLTCID